jgi:hypothetical protein
MISLGSQNLIHLKLLPQATRLDSLQTQESLHLLADTTSKAVSLSVETDFPKPVELRDGPCSNRPVTSWEPGAAGSRQEVRDCRGTALLLVILMSRWGIAARIVTRRDTPTYPVSVVIQSSLAHHTNPGRP